MLPDKHPFLEQKCQGFRLRDLGLGAVGMRDGRIVGVAFRGPLGDLRLTTTGRGRLWSQHSGFPGLSGPAGTVATA